MILKLVTENIYNIVLKSDGSKKVSVEFEVACVGPSLEASHRPHANLHVSARVYNVEGGAIFAKNSTFVFFDGFAWTPRLRSPSPIMAPGFIALLK